MNKRFIKVFLTIGILHMIFLIISLFVLIFNDNQLIENVVFYIFLVLTISGSSLILLFGDEPIVDKPYVYKNIFKNYNELKEYLEKILLKSKFKKTYKKLVLDDEITYFYKNNLENSYIICLIKKENITSEFIEKIKNQIKLFIDDELCKQLLNIKHFNVTIILSSKDYNKCIEKYLNSSVECGNQTWLPLYIDFKNNKTYMLNEILSLNLPIYGMRSTYIQLYFKKLLKLKKYRDDNYE